MSAEKSQNIEIHVIGDETQAVSVSVPDITRMWGSSGARDLYFKLVDFQMTHNIFNITKQSAFRFRLRKPVIGEEEKKWPLTSWFDVALPACNVNAYSLAEALHKLMWDALPPDLTPQQANEPDTLFVTYEPKFNKFIIASPFTDYTQLAIDFSAIEDSELIPLLGLDPHSADNIDFHTVMVGVNQIDMGILKFVSVFCNWGDMNALNASASNTVALPSTEIARIPTDVAFGGRIVYHNDMISRRCNPKPDLHVSMQLNGDKVLTLPKGSRWYATITVSNSPSF